MNDSQRQANVGGRFVFRRFNGIQSYALGSAEIHATQTDRDVILWFEASGDPDGASLCDDTEEFGRGRTPNALVGVELPALDPNDLVGRVFLVPGVGPDEDSYRSLVYFFEHQPLRQNRIAVQSRRGDRFRVHWTGVTDDLVYFLNPPTELEIEGEFTFRDLDRLR